MAALEDLEARVSALAASMQQREMAETQREQGRQLDDTNARVRSLEDTTSEIKDLLIRALDR